MEHWSHEDWEVGQLVVVPHAWRGDGLWDDIQLKAQERIGLNLREIYRELLQQPLSPQLLDMACEIERRLHTSCVE